MKRCVDIKPFCAALVLFLAATVPFFACIEIAPDNRHLWRDSQSIYECTALEDGYSFRFQVVHTWKGCPLDQITLTWPDMVHYGCYGPRPAVRGELYLVYLAEDHPLPGTAGDFGNPVYLMSLSGGDYGGRLRFLAADLVLRSWDLNRTLQDWRDGCFADEEFCQLMAEQTATARVEDWHTLPEEAHSYEFSPCGEMLRFLSQEVCQLIGDLPEAAGDIKRTLVADMITFLDNEDPARFEPLADDLDDGLEAIRRKASNPPIKPGKAPPAEASS